MVKKRTWNFMEPRELLEATYRARVVALLIALGLLVWLVA